MSKTQKYLGEGLQQRSRVTGTICGSAMRPRARPAPSQGAPWGGRDPAGPPGMGRRWPHAGASSMEHLAPLGLVQRVARSRIRFPTRPFTGSSEPTALCPSPESPAPAGLPPPCLRALPVSGPTAGLGVPSTTAERQTTLSWGPGEPGALLLSHTGAASAPRPVSVPPSPAPSSLSSGWDGVHVQGRSGVLGMLSHSSGCPRSSAWGDEGLPAAACWSRVAGQGPRELCFVIRTSPQSTTGKGDGSAPLRQGPPGVGAPGATPPGGEE